MSKIVLKPMNLQENSITIIGRSPLIVNAWSEKAKAQMRDKQQGKKTVRTNRDPQAEFEASIYRLANGKAGFPAEGVKACIVGAGHKDLGIPKTDLRKAFFILPDCEVTNRVEVISPPPKMREDLVSVGMSTDFRYRAEFQDWSIRLSFEYDADLIAFESLVMLCERAGFGVGLGEWRPERDGQYGRFEVLKSANT